MKEDLRPDNGPHAHELAECEAMVGDIEKAEQQYRAGCPVAARSHLYDVNTRIAALFRGEAV
jgi:hypothetical protein